MTNAMQKMLPMNSMVKNCVAIGKFLRVTLLVRRSLVSRGIKVKCGVRNLE